MKNKKKNELSQFQDNMAEFKHKCTCGHIVYLSKKHPKRLCTWCKNIVYLDKQEEFKEKLKKQLKILK